MFQSVLSDARRIILRKPPVFVLVPFAWAIFIIAVKWGIYPVLPSVLFLLGCGMGIYFLDLAEVFFRLNPSPFRSVVFLTGFTIVSLYVVSSAGSSLASGLVFAIYLTLILWQTGEAIILKNFDSWYEMFVGTVNRSVQWGIYLAFIFIFAFETWIFLH